MAILYLLCGIQGSGKSTYARNNKDVLDAEIISTDKIRQLFSPIDEKDVFPKAYSLIASLLSNDKNVIFDATNITKKVREKNLLNIKELAKDVNYDVICVFVNTNKDVCKQRVVIRNEDKNELYLPIDVIDNYYQNLEIPTLEEGFKKIIVV